eukprot:COSAG02_NODE_2701_length_8203_cov_7.719521_6_plen_74_part_00
MVDETATFVVSLWLVRSRIDYCVTMLSLSRHRARQSSPLLTRSDTGHKAFMPGVKSVAEQVELHCCSLPGSQK